MNEKIISLFLLSALSSILMLNTTKAEETKFHNTYSCIEHEGNPTTIVNTPRGVIQFIVWKSEFFSNSDWTPQRRCEEVSQRFQKFYDQGILKIITNGTMNRQPVICVAQNKAGEGLICRQNGLLITLEPTDNPQQVMEDLFDQNRLASGNSPLVRGNQTFVDIDNFLETAPVIESKPPKPTKPVIEINPIPETKPKPPYPTIEQTIPSQLEIKKPPVTDSDSENGTGVECPPLLCD